MAAKVELKPINPIPVQRDLTTWEGLAIQVEKVWLHIKYYFCCLASCLDYFGRRQIFKGCNLVAKAYNFGRQEDIPKYVQKVTTAECIGHVSEKQELSSNPFGAGVCYGASLLFCRNYLENGLENAAHDAAKGASYEAVYIQDSYHNIACQTEQEINIAVCKLAGFQIESICTSARALTILNNCDTWGPGIYSIAVPVYSCGKMWITIAVATVVLGSLWMVMRGDSITFWITNLQHVGWSLMGLCAVTLIINFKCLREMDGRHALTFIVEQDHAILHDPNFGTGTHQKRQDLLKNAFDFYVHVNGIQEYGISIQKLETLASN